MNLNYTLFVRNILNYSCKVQPEENVYVKLTNIPDQVSEIFARELKALGANLFLENTSTSQLASLVKNGNSAQFKLLNEILLDKFAKMHCYIHLDASSNVYEMSNIDATQMQLFKHALKPSINYRVNNLKWCITNWPCSAGAQLAQMNSFDYEEYFFKVCNFDYSKYYPGVDKLKSYFDNADKVKITGPGTDLSFSLKGLNGIVCSGTHNIPDGEVYSAPVKDSVNGVISFNCPSIYNDIAFDNIRLEFKKGKIINATSNNTEALNHILDTDADARYTGEFAIGFHPRITKPMRDILFDEKIAGSFHLTPGSCYEHANNGNTSSIHWDMVSIQTKNYGYGEIYFDDKLIRKDGIFVPNDLKCLNPCNLI